MDTFSPWFRASAAYIRAHRDRTFVVMLGADALASDNIGNIVHDLSLLHVLGVRLVVLLRLDDTTAELACLVGGDAVGPRLLAAVEEAAVAAGVTRLFALTTQAADWFLDHGFARSSVETLPVDRKALYNYRRNSHVLAKDL